MKIFKIENI